MRLVWIGLFLCVQVGAARGDGRVGLVNLSFVDVPDGERETWLGGIQHALEVRGLQVVSDANLRYVQSTSKELFSCFDEDRCRTEIGRRLQADLLLTGRIGHNANEWQANLTLHAVDLGTTSKNQVIHCPGCTAATFHERLNETVNDLVTADRALPRATLLVRTVPSGAAVRLDGRDVGTAEVELTVTAGQHRLEAIHPNHDPLDMNVEVRPQERLEVDLRLPPRSPPKPLALGKKPSWFTARRIAGVAMMAGGAALFISGIPLEAIDGDCASTHCIYKYDTGAAGGALLGVGAALLLSGGLVVLMSRNQNVQATVAPSVGAGGAGLVGEVRF